jgi:hypothetical protein
MRPVASIVLAKIGRVTLLFAFCVAFEFHWAALQSVAWTTMLMNNVCHAPLKEAVSKTFDGSHPCALCHAVSAAQKSEKKGDVVTSAAKIDLFCAFQTLNFQPRSSDHTYAAVLFRLTGRAFPPLVPPPRLIGNC